MQCAGRYQWHVPYKARKELFRWDLVVFGGNIEGSENRPNDKPNVAVRERPSGTLSTIRHIRAYQKCYASMAPTSVQSRKRKFLDRRP
jgi:hypothetical protein